VHKCARIRGRAGEFSALSFNENNFLKGGKMKDDHDCRYRFWRWLIEKAISSRRIYWLLWGMLAVTALCAWRFGLSGLLLL